MLFKAAFETLYVLVLAARYPTRLVHSAGALWVSYGSISIFRSSPLEMSDFPEMHRSDSSSIHKALGYDKRARKVL